MARAGSVMRTLSVTSSVSRRAGRAVAAQQRRDVVDQRVVEQVGGRQVGRDPPRAIEAEPGAGLADRHGQHAAAELAHELGLLDGGQEGAGGQQPALGVAPAHERLDAHELAGGEVGDRLVVQRQLVVGAGRGASRRPARGDRGCGGRPRTRRPRARCARAWPRTSPRRRGAAGCSRPRRARGRRRCRCSRRRAARSRRARRGARARRAAGRRPRWPSRCRRP